jgi:membrane-bound serine protease (ClpP class)
VEQGAGDVTRETREIRNKRNNMKKTCSIHFKKCNYLPRAFLLFVLTVLVLIGVSPASADQNGSNTIYVIPIQGEIDRSLVVFIRRSIERAEDADADLLLFDIDTFGGRVDSALQIATLIGSAEIKESIAYITTGPESTGVSWSAGALISFSTNRIFMSPGTSLGAAAPVLMGAEGPEAASEKVVSALRAQMAALAEKNGYPTSIARAMVDEDIELREVYIDGELRVLTSEEIQDAHREAKKSGLTVEEGKLVSPSGKLLTLTAMEMEKYGVSSGTFPRRTELFTFLGMEEALVVDVGESPADRAVGVLTGSAFTSILIIMGLVALFIEITSPGFGVPGTIAIVCFAIVFASYALLGTVGSLELIIFVLGLVLLILEIFVIPGFGVAGISGIALIVASLVLSMQGFVLPDFEWQRELFRRNILVVSLSTVSSIIIFGILAYSLPQMKLFNRLTLKASQTAEEGFTVQSRDEENRFLGKRGVATTTLRPAGKAEFDGEPYYVETEGEFVETGQQVEIIEVSGNRMIVRKC